MGVEEQVLRALESALSLKLDRARTNADTPLLGAMPEFDSMAAVSLLTTLEDSFGFTVDDDEIEGATFATVGTLTEFVRAKLGA